MTSHSCESHERSSPAGLSKRPFDDVKGLYFSLSYTEHGHYEARSSLVDLSERSVVPVAYQACGFLSERG